MSNYKLTYFDIDGGRAEPIRIAFHAAGIEFEDHRISFAEFGKIRSSLRFTCVPVLYVDGLEVSQSNAISRYVGKLAGLYPTDDRQALRCDEVLGVLEDLIHQLVHTFSLQGDELRLAREKLVDGWLTVYLKGLSELLASAGGEHFADNALTVADLKAFVQTRALLAGHLDHVPTDLVQRVAPNLLDHHARVEKDPRVKAYYASRV